MGVDGGGLGYQIVHAAEADIGFSLLTLEVDELADIAEAHVVNESRAQGGGITNGEALVVVVFGLRLRIVGEHFTAIAGNRDARSACRFVVVIHDPAQEQRVVSISGQVKVDFRHEGIQTLR